MLLRVFEEEHEEQVNHCEFTNTKKRLLLATCSNDKFLNVKVGQCVCFCFFKFFCITFPSLSDMSPPF